MHTDPRYVELTPYSRLVWTDYEGDEVGPSPRSPSKKEVARRSSLSTTSTPQKELSTMRSPLEVQAGKASSFEQLDQFSSPRISVSYIFATGCVVGHSYRARPTPSALAGNNPPVLAKTDPGTVPRRGFPISAPLGAGSQRAGVSILFRCLTSAESTPSPRL